MKKVIFIFIPIQALRILKVVTSFLKMISLSLVVLTVLVNMDVRAGVKTVLAMTNVLYLIRMVQA